MTNKSDYVELGLACADVCKALDRGTNGRRLDDLSQSVREAINQLTVWVEPVICSLDSSLTTRALDHRTVAKIQRKVIEKSGRNAVSRTFQARDDKDAITAWKLDLGRILQVFNVHPIIFTLGCH